MVRGGGFTERKDDFSPPDLLTTQRVYVTILDLSRTLVLRLCLVEVFLSSWQICELAKIGVGAGVFMARVQAGDFLEWAEVYGNCYGTLHAPVQAVLRSGDSILLDIDTQGAAQVRSSGAKNLSVFVLPPSVSALSNRLSDRGTDGPETIARRIEDASLQLRECGAFDYLVVNDDLESAHDQFQAIIVAELMRAGRHPTLIQSFSR